MGSDIFEQFDRSKENPKSRIGFPKKSIELTRRANKQRWRNRISSRIKSGIRASLPPRFLKNVQNWRSAWLGQTMEPKYPRTYDFQIQLLQESELFDAEWYLAQHPKVAEAGIDPIEHYITRGAALGFDPSPTFSCANYLKNNPDVAAAGVNPFLHFVQYGRHEGRHGEPNDYQSWVRAYPALGASDHEVFRRAIAELPARPLISVIMPVYNTELTWLRGAIESVRKQLYPHWELCISDNSSTLPGVKDLLHEYAQADGRIRVVYRDTNGHICRNSNSALELANGEFIALLDSDDELAEDALFWVADELRQHPDADLIYSDEDKIASDGTRYDAYFKSDWNPALILSQNFFSHLGVYRRSLVEKVGAFRVGLEGSQDHDLVLRCAAVTAPNRIRHIPRVLYHWRAIPGSTASVEGVKAKPYAWQAAATAIKEHLQSVGVNASVSLKLNQYYQVHYSLTGGVAPKVSIIMPSACKLHLLMPCLNSLFARTTYQEIEVLLTVSSIRYDDVDQAYFLRSLAKNPRIRILVYQDRPYNFSWINNWAASQSTGSILCFLNDDIEVITPDWVEKLVARLQLSGVGAVGPMLYYPDRTIQHAGVILGLWGVAGHIFRGCPQGTGGYFGRAALEQDLSCVTAACAAVKREAFDSVSGFREELAVAFNDVDFCIRLRQAGWRIIWTPEVEMYHHESASIGKHDSRERKDIFDQEVALMRKMWGNVLDNDPFYNPNLSLSSQNFSLAYPPRLSKLPKTQGDVVHELDGVPASSVAC